MTRRIQITDIKRTLAMPHSPTHVMFVDSRTALNPAPRDKVMLTPAEVGIPTNLLNFFAVILLKNTINIDYGVTALPFFIGTTEQARWDNLGPPSFFLIFSFVHSSVLLKGLFDQIRWLRKSVEAIWYADNLMTYESSRFLVQQAITRLYDATTDLGVTVNLIETKAM